MNQNEQVLISICLITYNHERYIEECLQSLITQNSKYSFEIIIGDDSSTDDNKLIISKYAERYSDIIKPIFRENNLGVVKNFVDTLSKCTGKYVALISGDDYWTDPNKLEKQVDFLEHNPEYVMICHDANLLLETKTGFIEQDSTIGSNSPFDFTVNNLMIGNPFVASQVMFRNHLIKEFPDIYFRSTGEDRQLYMLLSQYGKCRFIPEISGIYRVHSKSITQSRRSYSELVKGIEERIRNAEIWNEYFNNAYDAEVLLTKKKAYKQLLFISLEERNFVSAIKTSKELSYKDFHALKSKIVLFCLRIIDSFVRI